MRLFFFAEIVCSILHRLQTSLPTSEEWTMPLLTKSPFAEILAEINTKNNTTLTAADVKLTMSNPGSAVNTDLVVSPATGSRYTNQKKVQYHRRDIAKWFTGITVRVDAAEASTFGDVITLLNTRYGLQFTDNDFSASVRNQKVTYGSQSQLNLSIQIDEANSMGWVGALTVLSVDPGSQLDMIITTTQMDGLKYADGGDGTLPSAAVRTYPNNYSPQTTALKTVATGAGTISATLADALLALTPMQSGDAPFVQADITSANVQYNGPTSGYANANTAYSNVVVARCTNGKFYGNFMFHYNV